MAAAISPEACPQEEWDWLVGAGLQGGAAAAGGTALRPSWLRDDLLPAFQVCSITSASACQHVSLLLPPPPGPGPAQHACSEKSYIYTQASASTRSDTSSRTSAGPSECPLENPAALPTCTSSPAAGFGPVHAGAGPGSGPGRRPHLGRLGLRNHGRCRRGGAHCGGCAPQPAAAAHHHQELQAGQVGAQPADEMDMKE
jgi:hypothetical protein